MFKYTHPIDRSLGTEICLSFRLNNGIFCLNKNNATTINNKRLLKEIYLFIQFIPVDIFTVGKNY